MAYRMRTHSPESYRWSAANELRRGRVIHQKRKPVATCEEPYSHDALNPGIRRLHRVRAQSFDSDNFLREPQSTNNPKKARRSLNAYSTQYYDQPRSRTSSNVMPTNQPAQPPEMCIERVSSQHTSTVQHHHIPKETVIGQVTASMAAARKSYYGDAMDDGQQPESHMAIRTATQQYYQNFQQLNQACEAPTQYNERDSKTVENVPEYSRMEVEKTTTEKQAAGGYRNLKRISPITSAKRVGGLNITSSDESSIGPGSTNTFDSGFDASALTNPNTSAAAVVGDVPAPEISRRPRCQQKQNSNAEVHRAAAMAEKMSKLCVGGQLQQQQQHQPAPGARHGKSASSPTKTLTPNSSSLTKTDSATSTTTGRSVSTAVVEGKDDSRHLVKSSSTESGVKSADKDALRSTREGSSMSHHSSSTASSSGINSGGAGTSSSLALQNVLKAPPQPGSSYHRIEKKIASLHAPNGPVARRVAHSPSRHANQSARPISIAVDDDHSFHRTGDILSQNSQMHSTMNTSMHDLVDPRRFRDDTGFAINMVEEEAEAAVQFRKKKMPMGAVMKGLQIPQHRLSVQNLTPESRSRHSGNSFTNLTPTGAPSQVSPTFKAPSYAPSAVPKTATPSMQAQVMRMTPQEQASTRRVGSMPRPASMYVSKNDPVYQELAQYQAQQQQQQLQPGSSQSQLDSGIGGVRTSQTLYGHVTVGAPNPGGYGYGGGGGGGGLGNAQSMIAVNYVDTAVTTSSSKPKSIWKRASKNFKKLFGSKANLSKRQSSSTPNSAAASPMPSTTPVFQLDPRDRAQSLPQGAHLQGLPPRGKCLQYFSDGSYLAEVFPASNGAIGFTLGRLSTMTGIFVTQIATGAKFQEALNIGDMLLEVDQREVANYELVQVTRLIAANPRTLLKMRSRNNLRSSQIALNTQASNVIVAAPPNMRLSHQAPAPVYPPPTSRPRVHSAYLAGGLREEDRMSAIAEQPTTPCSTLTKNPPRHAAHPVKTNAAGNIPSGPRPKAASSIYSHSSSGETRKHTESSSGGTSYRANSRKNSSGQYENMNGSKPQYGQSPGYGPDGSHVYL